MKISYCDHTDGFRNLAVNVSQPSCFFCAKKRIRKLHFPSLGAWKLNSVMMRL